MIEQKDENNSTNNYLVYSLSFLLVVVIAIGGYIYSSSKIVDKNDYKENYIKIEDIDFSHLPSYVQSNYIEKYNCPTSEPIIETIKIIDNTRIEQLTNEIDKLKFDLSQKKIEIIEKIVTIEKKIPVIQKETIILNEDRLNTSNYKVARCYDMKLGDDQLSSKCEKNISKFLITNKNAKYFEVIGILDKNDFFSLKKLKKNLDVLEKLNLTPSKISKLEKFADFGLSTKRVEETIWFMNNNSKKNIKIFPANYTITSKYHNRGTIVRAYY
ncbi:MAG: hypothetical protein KAJ49_08475 [Arcobacteraceae bacterium]|nr:hypothetical protein [Arcobacteraceae bacterium]